MRLHRILDDLVFAERGYLNGNQVIALGGAPAVVDAGHVSWPVTARILSELGLAANDVRLVVNTHGHRDHVGGDRRLQERSGCAVALHPLGRRNVEEANGRATLEAPTRKPWTGIGDRLAPESAIGFDRCPHFRPQRL